MFYGLESPFPRKKNQHGLLSVSAHLCRYACRVLKYYAPHPTFTGIRGALIGIIEANLLRQLGKTGSIGINHQLQPV